MSESIYFTPQPAIQSIPSVLSEWKCRHMQDDLVEIVLREGPEETRRRNLSYAFSLKDLEFYNIPIEHIIKERFTTASSAYNLSISNNFDWDGLLEKVRYVIGQTNA